MKHTFKRIVSIWTAILMLISYIPTGALADDPTAAAEFDSNGLMVRLPGGALTPQQVLGGALEFGVVADHYVQTEHTETNFAVNVYDQNKNQSIEIVGSGTNPIPFYVGELPYNRRVWNGGDTNVDFDVFINSGKATKGKDAGPDKIPGNTYPDYPDNNHVAPYVQYSNRGPGKTNKATNVYGRSQGEITSYVKKLTDYVESVSILLADEADIAPNLPKQQGKVLDLTTENFPKTGTIYIDCENLTGFMSDTGWKVKKYEGQTLVFNIHDKTNVTIAKIDVTVLNASGTEIMHVDSATAWKDTNPTKNQNIDDYILKHFVFNVRNVSTLEINTAAGAFIAPHTNVVQNQGSGAGWIVTYEDFTSNAEWHFYYHNRTYQAYVEKGVNIGKTFTYQDGTTLPDNLKGKQFSFDMYQVDGTNFQKLTTTGAYSETVTGKAGDKIEFPNFGISHTDFPHGPDGDITGDQYIDRYYVIEEKPVSDDDTIVTDTQKIYLHLRAHGYDKDKIDISIWTSSDHENWSSESVGEHGSVGTFTNWKKQNTSVTVTKNWQRPVNNNGTITYINTTGEHTADSVELKLISVRDTEHAIDYSGSASSSNSGNNNSNNENNNSNNNENNNNNNNNENNKIGRADRKSVV